MKRGEGTRSRRAYHLQPLLQQNGDTVRFGCLQPRRGRCSTPPHPPRAVAKGFFSLSFRTIQIAGSVNGITVGISSKGSGGSGAL